MAKKHFLSGLQMKDGRWHQTHFVFHSPDPTLLPVVDIYNLPETNPGSHFHLEIGPVCFLWWFILSHLNAEGRIIPSDAVSHPWGSERLAPVCGSSIQKDPASLCQPPIGLQTQGGWVQCCREAAELWRRRGVLALIASHTAKASSCSSRIYISMPGWRSEGLYAKQSLWNITKWRETKAKLSQDMRVTYFFNCIPSVYCVYFLPGILLKEKNESFWDQLNVHNICLLLSFIPVYRM